MALSDSNPAVSRLCALCSRTGELKQSHVIPRFVYRALEQPDGASRPLLCGECEDRFSRWESQFARDVFHPLVAGKAVPVKYGPWLLKFGASVCWRILENARRENQLGAIPAGASLKAWSDFLRGRRPDAGAHHLYLIRAPDVPRRPAIGSELHASETSAWVHVGMGPLALIGLIHGEAPGEWSGTRLPLEGKLKPRPTAR